MNGTSNKIISNWLYIGAAFILLILIVGGITRVTDSGLSMVNWKLLMGAVPPLSEESWIAKFDEYKQFPEYKEVHNHFTLTEFKSIFFWEYLHRMLGRTLSFVFLVPFLFFLYKKWLSRTLVKKLLVVFVLGGCQGLLGWYMVKSGLVDQPDVTHFRLASHLSLAFFLVGYCLWLAFDLQFENKRLDANKDFSLLAKLILLLIFIQVIYGAFVAGLNAGRIYTTFPMMGDVWIAEGVYAMKPLWLNFISGIAGVQFVHRYLAMIIVAAVAYLWVKSRKYDVSNDQQKAINIMAIVVCIQFSFGVITLLSGAE